jgi:hypothetical protein
MIDRVRILLAPSYEIEAVESKEWCCLTTLETFCGQQNGSHFAHCRLAENPLSRQAKPVSVITCSFSSLPCPKSLKQNP